MSEIKVILEGADEYAQKFGVYNIGYDRNLKLFVGKTFTFQMEILSPNGEFLKIDNNMFGPTSIAYILTRKEEILRKISKTMCGFEITVVHICEDMIISLIPQINKKVILGSVALAYDNENCLLAPYLELHPKELISLLNLSEKIWDIMNLDIIEICDCQKEGCIKCFAFGKKNIPISNNIVMC